MGACACGPAPRQSRWRPLLACKDAADLSGRVDPGEEPIDPDAACSGCPKDGRSAKLVTDAGGRNSCEA